ncbi:STAS domain-containing protein [Streptomyces vinaceus]|uniref:STAS domain-containing protein n=1 Tax=Streptomyces vinaceus TaxID=1960 RepID=UPI00382DD435
MGAIVQRMPDENGVRIILCHGEFDAHSSGLLDRELREAAHERVSRVILDASQITFADSAFLSVLIAGHRALPLILAGPLQHRFAGLLATTRLDTVFHITPTLADAAEHP